ncbi:recombinase family protein [Clostridium sp. D2Q-11]|uniref:Recombinase family protein n=1 Tax=Anaeromonas frigoriresistens TaxID=2683708 RepID=A0A942V2A6_9FIRM|nr:recombinase family protein [Anaeromonas frigoriresistens]MBS4539832.1 recombinase family protein [Anaeromonas frigoriresistens]
MKKLKVCAYARVSTSSKDQENSFDNQKTYFEREIEKNEKYDFIGLYADKGITATSMNRRENFLRMIVDGGLDIQEHKYKHQNRDKIENFYTLSDRSPKFDRIFVKNTSRFARNIDVVDMLRKLRQKKVYVDFLDIGKTTEDEADFVFIEMLLIFDENESRDKSRKIRFGHKESMNKGVIMANSRLYGYKRVDKYTLKIIPEEAEIIKFMYEKYSEGCGIRKLIELLNKKGYKTRQGKPFSKTTISKILKNEKYKGILIRNKYDTGIVFVDKRTTPLIKDKDDWIEHKDVIPVIVSEELWDKVQEVRDSKISTKNQKGVYHGRSKYSGILKCGKCGSSYTRNSDRGKVFYNCSLKKRKGTEACDSPNIYLDYLEDSLKDLAEGEYYETITYDKDVYISRLYRIQEAIYNKMSNRDSIDYEKTNTELEKLKKQKDKLTDLYLEERIEKDYYNSKNSEIDRRIKELKGELKYINSSNKEIIHDLKEIDEIISKLENLNIKEKYTIDEIINELGFIEIARHFERTDELMLTFQFKLLTYINELSQKYIDLSYDENLE